jgi:hypothetical protein
MRRPPLTALLLLSVSAEKKRVCLPQKEIGNLTEGLTVFELKDGNVI